MNIIPLFLHPDHILLNSKVPTIKRLFEEIGEHVEHESGIPADEIIKQLWVREMLGSTALGNGVAVPHARVEGLKVAMALFIRTQTPIDFESPDRKPVTVIMALLAPANINDQHLNFLAQTARRFSNTRFRHLLDHCHTTASVFHLFKTPMGEWGPVAAESRGSNMSTHSSM